MAPCWFPGGAGTQASLAESRDQLGALLLLAFSTAMLAFSTHRAQQLADKEINFVAAVSHELRTPLAVISSAADNLADGVVRTEEQLLQYGVTIQNQARQLSDLVEQILLFAATRKSTSDTFALGTLQVTTVIAVALQNTDGLIRQEHVQVERDIAPALPAVIGDRTAASQVLQNLMTNAIKYGGSQKWLGIRAMALQTAAGKRSRSSCRIAALASNQTTWQGSSSRFIGALK